MFCRQPNVFWLMAVLSATGLIAAETASVSGTVVNEATGSPLRMAMVTISTAGAKPVEAAVYTDPQGAFSFTVPPGRYYLWAGESGYSTAWFGAPTADVPPAVLALAAGEVRQGVRLRLSPMAAISGTVVDQDNDPVPWVMLRLLVPTFVRGKATYRPRNGSSTDDRGEFRIHGIPPGRYYLVASAASPRTAASIVHPEVTAGETPPRLTYGTTFYPGVATIAEATPIDVRAGADIHNLALRLSAQESALVTGTVEMPDGITAGAVMISFAHEDELGIPSVNRFGMSIRDNKSFSATLAPGRYRVMLRLGGSGLASSEEVDVHPGPQEVTLHLSKPARLTGHLSVEGAAPNLTSFEIRLTSGDRTMPALTTPVGADGSFEFAAVSPGVWDINATPLPKDGFIKSMMLGDFDVLTNEMVIGPQTSAPLNIVVSARGAVVSGTVKEPPDESADLSGSPRAKVFLAPVGRYSDVFSFYAVTTSDASGRFELHGLTPGSYRIFAFDRMKAGAWQDPAFMKRIYNLGKPLEIHEGDHLALDLDVQPLPPAASEEP